MQVPNKIPYYRKGNERDAETCFLKMKLNQKSTVRQLLAPKRLMSHHVQSCAMKQTAFVGGDESRFKT